MLEFSFRHISGVGPSFENKLHAAGIFTWTDALFLPLPCGPKKTLHLRDAVLESQSRLEARDALWFSEILAPGEQWRLFPHFREQAAYVDIETTGLSWPDAHITTIALFDGNSVRTYVAGINLEEFADDILRYTLLVTWNGRSFDAPFLRRSLNIPLSMAHLDLLPVFRALGLRGGLKKVEKALNINRAELDGVDGWTAVLLWHEYERSNNPKALETLLAYNVADVLSLEYLAGYAVLRHMREAGCPEEALVHPCPPHPDANPFTPDRDILRRLGI